MPGPLPLPTCLAFVASDRPEAVEARVRLPPPPSPLLGKPIDPPPAPGSRPYVRRFEGRTVTVDPVAGTASITMR